MVVGVVYGAYIAEQAFGHTSLIDADGAVLAVLLGHRGSRGRPRLLWRRPLLTVEPFLWLENILDTATGRPVGSRPWPGASPAS